RGSPARNSAALRHKREAPAHCRTGASLSANPVRGGIVRHRSPLDRAWASWDSVARSGFALPSYHKTLESFATAYPYSSEIGPRSHTFSATTLPIPPERVHASQHHRVRQPLNH